MTIDYDYDHWAESAMDYALGVAVMVMVMVSSHGS